MYTLAKNPCREGIDLTGREKEILAAYLNGKTIDEMAVTFYISKKTVMSTCGTSVI